MRIHYRRRVDAGKPRRVRALDVRHIQKGHRRRLMERVGNHLGNRSLLPSFNSALQSRYAYGWIESGGNGGRDGEAPVRNPLDGSNR